MSGLIPGGGGAAGNDPVTAAQAAGAVLARPVYGGFWIRTRAWVIDILWLLPVVVALGLAMYGTSYFNVTTAAYRGLPDFLMQNGVLAVGILGFWFVRQATPGKFLSHLKIVDAATLGKPRPWQYLVRYFCYAPAMLWQPAVLLVLLGCFWVMVDRRHQGWHDKLARTVVLRVDD